jgi:hypothetical protein
VTLGASQPVELGEIVALLAGVLRSESEFCDDLGNSPEELLQRFEAATGLPEILRIARELE